MAISIVVRVVVCAFIWCISMTSWNAQNFYGGHRSPATNAVDVLLQLKNQSNDCVKENKNAPNLTTIIVVCSMFGSAIIFGTIFLCVFNKAFRNYFFSRQQPRAEGTDNREKISLHDSCSPGPSSSHRMLSERSPEKSIHPQSCKSSPRGDMKQSLTDSHQTIISEQFSKNEPKCKQNVTSSSHATGRALNLPHRSQTSRDDSQFKTTFDEPTSSTGLMDVPGKSHYPAKGREKKEPTAIRSKNLRTELQSLHESRKMRGAQEGQLTFNAMERCLNSPHNNPNLSDQHESMTGHASSSINDWQNQMQLNDSHENVHQWLDAMPSVSEEHHLKKFSQIQNCDRLPGSVAGVDDACRKLRKQEKREQVKQSRESRESKIRHNQQTSPYSRGSDDVFLGTPRRSAFTSCDRFSPKTLKPVHVEMSGGDRRCPSCHRRRISSSSLRSEDPLAPSGRYKSENEDWLPENTTEEITSPEKECKRILKVFPAKQHSYEVLTGSEYYFGEIKSEIRRFKEYYDNFDDMVKEWERSTVWQTPGMVESNSLIFAPRRRLQDQSWKECEQSTMPSSSDFEETTDKTELGPYTSKEINMYKTFRKRNLSYPMSSRDFEFLNTRQGFAGPNSTGLSPIAEVAEGVQSSFASPTE